MRQKWKNNAYSTLASALTNVGTTLTVSPGHGDRFPAVSAPDYFILTLQDAANNIEIVKVIERSFGSDSMTIERAQEGTTARAWALGDLVGLRVTAGGLSRMATQADPETLANKTIVAADNTIITAPFGNLTSTELNAALAELEAEKQPVSAALSAISTLDATPGVIAQTGVNTFAKRTIAGGTGIGVTNGDGASGNPTVAISDPELLAIAGLTSAANKGIHFTGSGTAATHDLSPFARTLLDDTTQAQALVTLGAIYNGVSAKNAAYTVVASDRGKLIDCTGTWPLSLTAAAALGNGFAFAVKNSGTGTITIVPNGSELIDGAATVALAAGESAVVVCDGIGFKTVSRVHASSNGEFRSIKVFTISGTWVKPAGLKRIKVTVVGGGGGGNNGGTWFGGGGGGGAAIKVIPETSLSGSVTVTVGAGGTGSNNGGTSSFGAFCSATGGAGGSAQSGGIGLGGDINIRGGSASIGYRLYEEYGPDFYYKGGDSILGGGGLPYVAGGNYGGGGGQNANGAPGVVIVEEFF